MSSTPDRLNRAMFTLFGLLLVAAGIYGLLRGYFHGADDDNVDALQHARLLSVTLPSGSGCLGRCLGDKGVAPDGVTR